MMKVAKSWRPELLIILGDFADFYSVSQHDKDPGRVSDLLTEVTAVKARLKELEKLGCARKVFIAGNHENRLERYLSVHAPALFRCVTVEELFELKAGGWDFVPYKRAFHLGKLRLTHDVGSAGVNAHRGASKAFMASAIIGHTHRMVYEVTGTYEGTPYLGAHFGWLGDREQVDYVHAAKAAEWPLGFGVGVMEPNGVVHVQPVPIIKGACCVAGEIYRL